jgi:hypothetical protein
VLIYHILAPFFFLSDVTHPILQMHQYKTMAQTLLVFSILNLVFAAPVVPQEHDTGGDIVVVPEDVATGSDRQRGTPPGGTTGTTPSQYPSSLSDGSPHPLSAAWDLLHQKTNRLNTGASDGPAPVPDSNTEASTSSHQPVPVPDSTADRSRTTSQHYTAITPDMLYTFPHRWPTGTGTALKAVGVDLFGAAAVAGFVVLLKLPPAGSHSNNTRG